MKNLTISQKLIISYLSLGIITVILISVIFYFEFKSALTDRTKAQLSSVNVLKKSRIEDFFITHDRRFKRFMLHPEIIEISRWANQTPSHDYPGVEVLETLQKDFEYKDIIILNNHNVVVYPIYPENAGKLNPKLDSIISFHSFSLTKTFSNIDVSRLSNLKETVVISGSPIILNSQKHGFLIAVKDLTPVFHILSENTGMGNTGESYIVGKDLYMRSESRFIKGKSPLQIEVNTKATHNAFNNHEGISEVKDYRQEEVLSAHRKLKVAGLEWVILSEMDIKEVMEPVHKVRNYILLFSILISLIIVLVTLFLSKKIAYPIKSLRVTILSLSKGILPENKVVAESKDEIGQMSDAIEQLIEGLKRTSAFAAEIGSGNLQSEFQPLSDEDVLGKSLLQMREQLEIYHNKEREFIRQRSSALLEGQENERRRLARELHDGIGQMLTAAKLRVGMMEGQAVLQTELKKILDETIAEMRTISFNLMPSVLIDFGLQAALRLLCSNTGKYLDALIRFTYDIDKDKSNPDFETSIGLYRITQEAINNTIKYADATRIDVSVNHVKDNLILQIADNGVGFNINEYGKVRERQMNGLKNMEERARLLNGKFEIMSGKESGTVIIVTVPLK